MAKVAKQNNENKIHGLTVGLDIGTSKVCCLVAAPGENGNKLNIFGMGIAESDGLNRGVVVNIDRTVKTIANVIEQAEKQSGEKVEEVVVGIAGDHIESHQTRAIVGISNPNHEITRLDVQRLLEDCKKIAIPSERRILHVIPQEFFIDGQGGIIDPVGMSGVRLEANVTVVTALVTAIQNIHRCLERLNLKVKEIVLEPIASSYAVLDDEEKEIGVALIDIGAGTTDIAVFVDNILRFTCIIAFGGRQITDDVRTVLGILASQAEKVKKENGYAHLDSMLNDEVFMIPGIGGRRPMEVTKSYLCRIIQPRLEEIFEFALSEIRRSGYISQLNAGIVITGGCSLLRGMEELAIDTFGMPVKIGIPSGITYSGLAPEIENPIYSTVVGLVLHSIQNEKFIESLPEEQKKVDKPITNIKKNFFSKVKEFIEEL